MNVPYTIGSEPPPDLPLGRFLPPIPRGMAVKWCRENLNPGELILDPFGFNPLLPIEIAAAGFSIIVTVNNPIHAFLLKVLASAPQKDELVAALQDLATSTKGDDRMEPYIRSLYFVNCVDCRRQVEAEAFIWKKGSAQPYAAIIACPHCGARGEQLLTAEAIESLAPIPAVQLHQARALNRIASRDDPLREQVENALNAYPARPIIILQTIINKLDSLEQSPRRRELLTALILSAADQGNTLWAYPTPRERPRQIVVPSVFREKNLWKAMEEAIQTWQVISTPIPVIDWEERKQNATGIFRFKGRVKELDLADKPDLAANADAAGTNTLGADGSGARVAAVLTALPRPNQAFWTLSALWTGWIWGQDAVTPIRQVLARQRYDWNWHSNALKSVFETIQDIYHPGMKFWGLVAENEPLLLLAALLAANEAGFQLSTFAQSRDDQIAQCTWTPHQIAHVQPAEAHQAAELKMRNYLEEKGEPADFQALHTAIVTGLAHENQLALDIFMQNRHQSTSETQKWIENILQNADLLVRISSGSTSLETGEWWIKDPSGAAPPLIDRVEEFIVRHLIENTTTTASTLKAALFQAFPGLHTPQDLTILNCLESYAELMNPEEHLWQLRETEYPAIRNADINDLKQSLSAIAEKLNFKVNEGDPILWFEQGNPSPVFSIHIFSSAIISRHLQKSTPDAQYHLLILPGSRANLLAFKQERDPLLKEKLDRDYLVVKFRLIRDLAANPLLSRDLFLEQIQADPPEYRSSQLALF